MPNAVEPDSGGWLAMTNTQLAACAFTAPGGTQMHALWWLDGGWLGQRDGGGTAAGLDGGGTAARYAAVPRPNRGAATA